MDNKIKSKTRLAAIQLVCQHLISNEDIKFIKEDFDKYYHNVLIDQDTKKIEYNVKYLSKLVSYFQSILTKYDLYKEINHYIKFERSFEKWDSINKAITLMAICEIRSSKNNQTKIILNDYLEISKLFVILKETKIINAIMDKLINEKKEF